MSSPDPIPAAKPRPAASFYLVLCGVSIFLTYQFVTALFRLTNSSGKMDNKFNAIARDEFIGFLIGQNALMLLAYLILAILASLLIQPFASWLARRFQFQKKSAIILIGLFAAGIIHFFFILKLVDTRPYFLQEAAFGSWYYHLLDLIPTSIRPFAVRVIFRWVPVILTLLALRWHLARWIGKKPAGIVLIVGLLLSFFQPLGKNLTGSNKSQKSTATPNVLILSADSLRGDRLGVSGYRPARSDGLAAAGVSPVIDSLAARSTNFENCYAAIGSTLESSTSFMASQYPHTHGLRHMFPNAETLAAAKSRTVPIAKLLREQGYDTAAIGDWCAGFYELMPLGFEHISVSSFDNFKIYMSQAVVMAHVVVPLYFDHPIGYRIFPQLNSFANFVTPDVVTKRVQDRFAKVAETKQPFFWHVFYSCTHLPYRATEPYSSMFSDPAYEGPNKNAVAFDIDAFTSSKNLEAKLAAMPPNEVQQIRALYDGCTRQFDDNVGRVLDSLKKNGLAENTIVIITGDHGDDLYEPGVTLLHGQGFNGGLQASHVPMIVHVPGVSPKVIPETVRLIDVMPTIADFTGLKKPAAWEGQSFADWVTGTTSPEWRPFYGETGFPFMQAAVAGVVRPPLAAMDEMTFIEPDFNYQFVLKDQYDDALIRAKQRCLATRYWKLVCTPAADGTRHFGLFHRPSDPHGRTDLAASRPEILAPLRAALTRWIDEKHESSIAEIFPAGEPQ